MRGTEEWDQRIGAKLSRTITDEVGDQRILPSSSQCVVDPAPDPDPRRPNNASNIPPARPPKHGGDKATILKSPHAELAVQRMLEARVPGRWGSVRVGGGRCGSVGAVGVNLRSSRIHRNIRAS